MQTVRRTLGAFAIGGLIAASAPPLGAQAVPTQDNETVVVTGHGWGHGRGLGQYGAQGYAVDYGWSSAQILDHYYGGTEAGVVANDLLTVRIDSANGLATTAAVDSGALVLVDDTDAVTHIGTGGAIRLTATPTGFIVADAPDCSGPFVDRAELLDLDQVRISTATAPRPIGRSPIGAGTPVVGDWDGDGDDDLGVVDGATWRLWNTGPADAESPPDHELVFGGAGDIPVVGDWDGDGIDTPGTFAVGSWTLRSSLSGAEETTTFAYGGNPEDVPVVGDWDGDGDDDHGIRRERAWLLRTDDGTGPATWTFNYGRPSDTPIVGDWNADGVSDIGFVRGRTWNRRIGFVGDIESLPAIEHGPTSFEPVVGDWDGAGPTELALGVDGTVDRWVPLASLAPRLDPDQSVDETIQRCVSESEQRYYRGELRAVANDGSQRTVNAVPVESYLRAVVPLEMPASWAPAAVQAQAVSARSYSLAEDRTSYARTCDTTSCQVYGGRAVRRNGELSINEHPLSDEAIAQTAGVVRMRDGEVARTEFSSSTGGWTAGGVFPSVEDLGDAVSINPNHDWAFVLDVELLEARFSGRTLDRVLVSERNGLGRDGGRVTEVTMTFGSEVFTMTGNEFRRAFGLKSDWYTIDWERSVRRTDCICPEWPDHGLDTWFDEPPVEPVADPDEDA